MKHEWFLVSINHSNTQVIPFSQRRLEFEEATEAKSRQAIGFLCQLVAVRFLLFVIDDRGMNMTQPSEEPSQH